MNEDNRIIPIVEDDQGEGYKDLVETPVDEELERAKRKFDRLADRVRQIEHAKRFKA